MFTSSTVECQQTDPSSTQDVVTILTSLHPMLLACKTHSLDGEGKIATTDYGRIKHWKFRELPVSDLDSLRAVLDKLASGSRSVVVRGRIKEDVPRQKARRLSGPCDQATCTSDPCKAFNHQPTLEEHPRRWVLFDFDQVDVSCDRLDGDAAAAELRTTLPEAFHKAACWWQQTSSAGIKPGARMRLAFWLSRPVGHAEMFSWCYAVGSPVDYSLLLPAQVTYIANPRITGFEDPVPVREGNLTGTVEAQVPDQIPLITRGMLEKSAINECRETWFKADPARYIRQIMDSLSTTEEAELNDFGTYGRHAALLNASLRIKTTVEQINEILSDEDIEPMSEEDFVGDLQEAARKCGLTSDRDINRHIRNGFRIYRPIQKDCGAHDEY